IRDLGLLQGKVSKQIVEPIVPPIVVHHLIRLLQEEGIPPEQVAHHPDWKLWLWDAARAQKAIEDTAPGEGEALSEGRVKATSEGGGKPRPYYTSDSSHLEEHVG